MKIRVKIPDYIAQPGTRWEDLPCREFVDDVILWGMESGMDVEFYSYHVTMEDRWSGVSPSPQWAVFTVDAFMFSLKWGATMHKNLGEKNGKTTH